MTEDNTGLGVLPHANETLGTTPPICLLGTKKGVILHLVQLLLKSTISLENCNTDGNAPRAGHVPIRLNGHFIIAGGVCKEVGHRCEFPTADKLAAWGGEGGTFAVVRGHM